MDNETKGRLAQLQGAYNRLAGLLGDATYRRGQCEQQIEAARRDMDAINAEAAQLRSAPPAVHTEPALVSVPEAAGE